MLPLKAIDRLFQRMLMVYGTEWSNKWRSMDDQEVKGTWAKELGSTTVEELSWAVNNLPVHAPNLIQFKDLCRQAPRKQDVPVVEWNGKTDEATAKKAIEQAGIVINSPKEKDDGREWARKILKRQEGGELLSPAVVDMANAALKARFV